ncbi:MAG TPA: VWA domain-containing protein [Candidatus Altiarchaeales archaeon]|nr:VWA domain-containing protein [Candidatus Altiarchaeales archaeon]
MKSFRLFEIFVLLLCIGFTIDLVSADGIIIPEPIPDIEHIPPLAIKYHHVDVTIDNQYARTEIDQVFLNDFYRDLEGTYIFPLPEEASISKFSMYVDDEELVGEILEKDKAREIYESIVRRLEDPALLEYVGRNMFKARVYPIPAKKNNIPGEKRIKLSYEEIVKCDSGICRYVYPLEPEGFSSKPLESVVITVKLKSNQPIKTIYSPTHKISIKRKDDYSAEISYEEENLLPEKDFELYYTISEGDFGINLLTHREREEDGFFMLMVAPKQDIEEKIIGKDIVFVIDTSGSMSGKKIEQAKNALEFCIKNLNEDDRFNIITFESNIEKFSDELVSADPDEISNALDFVDRIESGGGTNINEALLDALKMMNEDERPNIIIFLTDGKPTVGVRDIEEILENVKNANTENTRIFVFGVGYEVNTHLLDKISQQNKGVSEYVKPEEDIEIKISNFYTKIKNPVLSDLELEFENIPVKDMYPKELPDLFKGSQLIIFGRYSGSGDSLITLKGRIGDKEKTFTYEATFPRQNLRNEFIPRLWATRKIGYLLDEIRLHGEEKELVDEIIELSLKYGIMTPYTSFLVEVDTEYGRPVRMEETRNLFDSILHTGEFWAPTGIEAVRSAKKTNELKSSDVYETGSERVKSIGTKTFYYKDDVWTDNSYSSDMKTTDIVYGSETYFQMLRDYPEIGKYLSLGKKVKFCLGDECFNIGEHGVTTSTVTIPTTTTIPKGEEEPDVLSQTLLIVGSIVIICAGILIWSRIRE